MRTKKIESSKKIKFLAFISIFLVLILIMVWSRGNYQTPIGINLVDTSSIQYGDTTVSGFLIKDVPVGQDGIYILTPVTGIPIILENVSGIDTLVGKNVVVKGYLSPPTSTKVPAIMSVVTISLENL